LPPRAPNRYTLALPCLLSGGSAQNILWSAYMKFRFPIFIIDEDYRSENASGLGIRAVSR